MPNASGPYLVRDEQTRVDLAAHSYNQVRRSPLRRTGWSWERRLRIMLLLLGTAALGYYGYSLADQYVYQAYENWSFDQQIAGRSAVTFADYVREQTSLGFLLGQKEAAPQPKVVSKRSGPNPPVVPHGSILGRVSIARLNISSIVREGVDAGTLSTAVGHVPSTSLPGQLGNFSIAAHRDTLFRALRNIRIGDRVDFQLTSGSYAYRVIATQIVRPSNVSVLRADGGPGLLQRISDHPTRLLTMITCYPFNYIGSAPERFIVQAEAIEAAPAAPPVIRRPPVRTRVSLRRRPAPAPAAQSPPPVKPKKRGFWHRVFRVS